MRLLWGISESWTVALEQLIADPTLRARIAHRAKIDKAAALYGLDANANSLCGDFRRSFNQRVCPPLKPSAAFYW